MIAKQQACGELLQMIALPGGLDVSKQTTRLLGDRMYCIVIHVFLAHLDILKEVQGKNVSQRLPAIISVVEVALLQHGLPQVSMTSITQDASRYLQHSNKHDLQTKCDTRGEATKADPFPSQHLQNGRMAD